MIEVTDDIAFPRRATTNVIGQQINTSGLRLFDEGGGVPTIKPSHRAYDAEDRAYHVKHEPLFIKAADLDGNDVEEFVDIPIYAHPYNWTASELAQVKYESILAENYPYQVVIGEEFLSTDHIDTGNSSDYVLSEGKCMLAPGGVLQTSAFEFVAPKRAGSAPTSFNEGMQYVFDTYYFSTEPEFPQGVRVYWQATWDGGSHGSTWQTAITDAEMPTSDDNTSTLRSCTSITFKIHNLTTDTFEIENYMLFLRLRTVP
jgi:hypothetical protein